MPSTGSGPRTFGPPTTGSNISFTKPKAWKKATPSTPACMPNLSWRGKTVSCGLVFLKLPQYWFPFHNSTCLGTKNGTSAKRGLDHYIPPMAPAPSPENINAKPRWMSSLVYELWGYPYLPNDNIIWYLHGTIPGSPSHPAKESPKLVVQWLNAERQLGSFISLKNNVFDTMTTKLLFSFGGWLGTSCWSNNINPK